MSNQYNLIDSNSAEGWKYSGVSLTLGHRPEAEDHTNHDENNSLTLDTHGSAAVAPAPEDPTAWSPPEGWATLLLWDCEEAPAAWADAEDGPGDRWTGAGAEEEEEAGDGDGAVSSALQDAAAAATAPASSCSDGTSSSWITAGALRCISRSRSAIANFSNVLKVWWEKKVPKLVFKANTWDFTCCCDNNKQYYIHINVLDY